MTDAASVSQASAGWFDGRLHRLPVRIYYEDTDFTGLVYHANFLRYFERGRSDYLRLAGVTHADLLNRPDPCAFVVTRLELDFRRAARIDDSLIVETAYDTIRGPRLSISQALRRDGELIAQACVEAACITPQGRARRPPSDLVDQLRPRLLTAIPP